MEKFGISQGNPCMNMNSSGGPCISNKMYLGRDLKLLLSKGKIKIL